MINKIIDSLSLTIYNEFKDDYKIYTEEIRQGLKTPCFFINALNPSENLFRNNKYTRNNQFCIQYIPNDTSLDKKYDCNEIREKLFSLLEYITIIETDEQNEEIKTIIRGNQMSGEYSDGVLNFFVNYDMFINKVIAKSDSMSSYDYNSEVKER